MSDHDHDHKPAGKSEEKAGEPMSRRNAAKHALKVLLVGGASVLGLAMMSREAKAGYGACSVSGCPCQAYMGNQNLCENCGHQYGMHW